jgi:hypothetical protein
MDPTPNTPKRVGKALRFRLGVIGALSMSAMFWLAEAGDLAHHRSLVTGLMLAMGCLWATGLWLVRRVGPSAGTRGVLPMVLFVAVALRIFALGAEPNLSDDVWRYVWEGGLVAEGKSPYAQAPDAPALAPERAAWPEVFEAMNNTDVSAAYPPVTQAAAAAVVALSGGPTEAESARLGLRIFFSLADLLVLLPLGVLLRRRGLSDALLITWAWCPLVVLEFAASAHFDSLGVLLMFSAIALLEPRPSGSPARSLAPRLRSGLGLTALGAAFLVKFLPLLAFPFLLRRSTLRHSAQLAAMLGLILALGLLPVLLLEGGFTGIFDGLASYGLRWQSWNLMHRFVEPLFTVFGDRDNTWTDPRKLSKLFTGGLAGLWILRLFLRNETPLRATGLALCAFLLVSPTLHPWYLAWIIPFLAFHHGRAWVFLVVASPLLYWPLTSWQIDGQWIEPGWLWPAVALPFYALFVLDALRLRQARLGRDAS